MLPIYGVVETQLALMANQSFSLPDIAYGVGIPLAELLISCFYCQKVLTVLDKILFAHSKLLVVWKDNAPFACCTCCIRDCARLDFLRGFQRAVPFDRFSEVSSYPWQAVIVRCFACLRQLNEQEKLDIAQNNHIVCLVKGGFRAKCCLCRMGI